MKILICVISFLVVLNKKLTVDAVETEYRKQEFLDAHNYLRGAVYPQSSNMLKLKWDDSLARFAASNAIKCLPEHSTSGPTLESFYGFNHNNVSKIVFYWFQERKEYPNRHNLPSSRWGHYELLATAGVEYVGCAITKTGCGSWNYYFAFCSYRKRTDYSTPAGLMYRPGKPCSACPQDISFCQNNLCVRKKTEGTCKKVCHNCGDLWPSVCRCNCRFQYNYYPDCSVLRKNRSPISWCRACSFNPPSRQPCENGGRPRPPKCSTSCNCPQAFTGQYCQYSKEELAHGAMLVFHWTSIRGPFFASYYPMNIRQGKPILLSIQDIVINAINSQCSSTIDHLSVSVGKGFPFIDAEGRLKMVLLVKGISCGSTTSGSAYLPQRDLIRILTSVKSQMSAASVSCCGTPLGEVKIPSIE